MFRVVYQEKGVLFGKRLGILIFLIYLCGVVEKTLSHGSLFSGIGGFDLASQKMGWKNVFQVENDRWCNEILLKNFPKVKRYGNIEEFNGAEYKGYIDILTGGFPCQPFSHAGKRGGEDDERYLWDEMFRVIKVIEPRWVIAENVYGLVSMEGGRTFERICVDLENQGYKVWSFIIPAAAVKAWHKRDRVWIIAHTNGLQEPISTVNDCKRSGKSGIVPDTDNTGGRQPLQNKQEWQKDDKGREGQSQPEFSEGSEIISNTNDKGLERRDSGKLQECTIKQFAGQGGPQDNGTDWKFEPGVGRVAYGIPGRVDRLKGLGNAIVPQVAYEIFKIIKQYE